MRITFITTLGSGFAGPLELSDGATVADLLAEHIVTDRPLSAYAVSVNGDAADGSNILHEGDRVAMAPRQVRGACVQDMRVFVLETGPLTVEEKRAALAHAGRLAGWDDPAFDVYNDLDPRQ